MAMPELMATVNPLELEGFASHRRAAPQGSSGLCFVEQQIGFQATCPLDQLLPLFRGQIKRSGINAFVEQAGFFEQLARQCITLREQLFNFLDDALEAYRLDDFAINNHVADGNGCRVWRHQRHEQTRTTT